MASNIHARYRPRRQSTYVFCNPDAEELEGKRPNQFLLTFWLLFGVWLFGSLTNTFVEEIWDADLEIEYVNGSIQGHSRTKRFIYMSNDRRLNLPKGTILDLESTASLPGFNPLPPGYGSETAISIPFDVLFDDLGWTSEDNTFGEIPFFTPLLEWLAPVKNFTDDILNAFNPNARMEMKMSEGGGERILMYQVVEDTLHNLGIDGKSCLLRTICEVHAEPLFGHGLFGEILELVLSVSSSKSYLHILGEYLEAEMKGKHTSDCSEYEEKCPLSIFGALTDTQKKHEQTIRKRFIEDESNYAHLQLEEESGGRRITREDIRLMETNHTARATLSREKRMIFFGPAGRLMFPAGSIFIIKPQLKLPWMTNLPDGFGSGLNIGVPLRAIFDDMGITSDLNPFMRLPFGSIFVRRKREAWRPLPGVNYEGGDREYTYTLLEHALDTWGFEGRACLLRAVCEMNQEPFDNHGLFGEILQLFLTPSKSLHAQLRMKEYYEAEMLGQVAKYCKPFYNSCPHSIFISREEKEKRIIEDDSNFRGDEDEEELEDNFI